MLLYNTMCIELPVYQAYIEELPINCSNYAKQAHAFSLGASELEVSYSTRCHSTSPYQKAITNRRPTYI
jgi:hypothetical protein